jgi:hypothetical protein
MSGDNDKNPERIRQAKSTRRKFLGATAASAAAIGFGSDSASAAPNGTRPTVLSVTSVVAANAAQMRVTGRLTDLNGVGLAGMRVDIYSVFVTSFTRWATLYTDNVGNFSATCSKVPVGAKIQVVVDGNGAFSQPFPTFSRV